MKLGRPSLLFLLTSVACASASRNAREGDDPRVVQMDPMRFQTEPDPLTGLENYDAGDLLAKGNELFDKTDFDKAVKVYDYLVKMFGDSSLVPTALYNSGLAFEHLQESELALTRFQEVIAKHPNSPHAKDAYYRSCLNLAKLERWKDVETTYWTIRQLEGLSSMDEIEARVGLAVALFMQEEYATAEKEFLSALYFYEQREKQEYIPANYWVAQSRFYLGEIYARYFEDVALKSDVQEPEAWKEKMGEILEEKCQLLLRSQNNLIRTIRVGHTGWATAAGFRIGSLYERLYDEMMQVPVPQGLSEDAAEIYVKELKKKLGVLVSKSIQIYERSLEMAERVGEKNDWVDRTHQALERMKNLALESVEETEEEATSAS